ncbi:MAG: hypothetical protein AB1744_14570, partial [Candidatus Zixiibacteriota bacterium]
LKFQGLPLLLVLSEVIRGAKELEFRRSWNILDRFNFAAVAVVINFVLLSINFDLLRFTRFGCPAHGVLKFLSFVFQDLG